MQLPYDCNYEQKKIKPAIHAEHADILQAAFVEKRQGDGHRLHLMVFSLGQKNGSCHDGCGSGIMTSKTFNHNKRQTYQYIFSHEE